MYKKKIEEEKNIHLITNVIARLHRSSDSRKSKKKKKNNKGESKRDEK